MNILRNATITSCDIMMRSIDPVPFTLPDNPFSGDIIQTRREPGVQVSMPLTDWEHLIRVYESHYRPWTDNPAVRDAWQKYQLTIALTQKV